MSQVNPTIIAGTLDDSELLKSVQSLVSAIDRNTQSMAASFDNAISRMTESWGKLTQAQNVATESSRRASRERITMLDQEAAAMQKATRPSTAQDSYYGIVKNMRENVALLSMEIKSMPSMSLDKQFSAYMQYEHQIEQVRQRIAELRQQMQEMANDPNATRLVKKQTLEEISSLEQKILQIEREQIIATRQIADADKAALAGMQARYETERRELINLSVGQREKVSFTREEAQAQGAVTEEIRKQAQAIRESSGFRKRGVYEFEDKYGNFSRVLADEKKYGTIEEQLLQIENARANSAKELANNERVVVQVKQEEEATNQRLNQAEERRLGIEREITREQEKRKPYVAPDAYNLDVTRSALVGLISSKNNIQPNQVVNWDEQTSSIKTLQSALKQYQDAYVKMTAEERNSPFGKQMIADMHVLEMELRKLRSEMGRMSWEQLSGLKTNSLDDMAFKMRQLNAYRQSIDLTKPTAATEIRQVDTAIANLQKEMDKYMSKSKQVEGVNNALSRSWNYMKNRLAFYFTIGASTQFVKQLIEIRGQYEMTERALGILVDSAERGSEIFRQLSDMALVSPYTLIELSNAAKQLTAYDVAAKDVVDTTRRLADMSAAVGAPIERLTYALGQIKAYGYLNSRDARMFANAGIPLVKQLSEYYTELEGRLVTTAEVYDRIKKKAIDYNTVMQVINKMTDEGGKFFDFQAKMADTLKVQLANLTLAWNNMLNDIGRDQQGIITYGIKGLKELFLNWRALDSAIRNVAYTFGAFKAYQAIILLFSGSLKTSAGWAALVGQRLTNLGIAIGKTAAALATNPVTWIVAAVSAFISLLQYTSSVREETRKLNEEIANGAKEAADSINKYISSDSAKNARNAALSGSLTPADAKKTWDGIREQIELSSKASDVFISKLLEEEDLNKRVTKAFDVAEKIRDAQNALSDLENELKVHQDSWANGLFGEGLAEDIEDFTNALENNKEFAKKAGLESWYSNNFIWTHGSLPYELKEATSEIEKFATDAAEVIRERLGKEGVKDAEKVTEAVARIVSGVEAANPKIRGAGKLLFETMVDQTMSNYFGQQFYDSNTALYRKLFDQIKKDSGSLFTDLDDRFLAENARWDDEREKAIRNAGEKIKKDLPGASRNAIDKILQQLNTTQFRLNIIGSIGQGTRREFQKTFDERSAGNLLLLPYRPSAEENLADWTTKQQQAIKKNDEEIKKYARDNSEYAKQQKRSLEDENELRKQALDLFNQLHQAEKSGAKKDPLGDAFAKEVQVIGDITKRYKEYQQMGVSAQDAIRLATDEYGNTLARLNAQLGKYGIATKTSDELASMDIRGIRDYYNELLEGAKNTNNAKGIEALEKALAGINVEITKLDYKKITDGLNNELSKLKDEYELAVELDANPEMSNLFMELFDIDPNALPHSIDDYAQRVLDKLNKSFEDRKIDFRLPTLKLLTEDDIKAYKEQLDAGIIDKATFDGIEKAYNDLYAMREKNAKETLKSTQELQYKLADVNGKIAIEQKKLADLEVLYQKEANAEKKRLLELQIQDQRNTIAELQSQALALMPEYERVFGSIIEHSAHTSRRLQKDLLDVYNKATRNAKGDYVLTGSDGSTTILTEERYTRERNKLTKEMQKSMSDFNKIKEAFKPSDEDDVVDYAKGIELVGSEIQKLGALMGTIGNIAEGLGFSEESVEILNDVSATLDGLGQATQGYAKIMNGDVIGGLTDMVTGLWNSISAWTDNSDKRITREVEKSERAVRRLELAYKDLEYEVNKAYGTAAVSARQLAIENKKLQLAELERQLALEESRSGKKRDEDRIIDLKGQIKDLRNEINDSVEEITNTLLGISSVGDAVENMVGVVIEALRNGESGIDAFNNSIDDMIFNLMKKWASTKYLAPIVEKAMKEINAIVNNETGANELSRLQMEQLQIQEALKQAEKVQAIAANKNIIAQLKERYEQNEKAIEAVVGGFGMDETKVASIKEILEGLKQEGQGLTDFLNLIFENFGVDVNGTAANLSALQQGIQGITEETAGAIEAYLNGVSQQVYLHSTLLTEIRDAVVGFNLDVQSGTIGEILLQLQNSYQVQMSIESMLNGWNNASGRAIRVEMVS